MIQSFKMSFKILKSTKGFFLSMVFMPIIMIILVNLTLSYSNTPMIAYVGDSESLMSVEGIRLKPIEKDEIDYFLGSNQGTLVVECDKDGNIYRYHSSMKNNSLISHLEKQMELGTGKYIEEKPKVEYSVGLMIFKLITGASLFATFLIIERNNGIFLRIKNGKTPFPSYILGKALSIFFVYEIASLVIITFYYFAGYDLGNSDILSIFLVFTSAVIFSLGLYLFVGSFMKNEGYIWVFSTGILFPLALCSGLLFPMETMPSWMKAIGHITPQYYFQSFIIKGDINITSISVIFAVSLVFAFLGYRNFNKKI